MLKQTSPLKIEPSFNERLIKSQECLPYIKYNDNNFNIHKYNNNFPLELYNRNQHSNFLESDFSVRMKNPFRGEIPINKINPLNNQEQKLGNKLISFQKMQSSFSDLKTSASFNSLKSSDSLIINNGGVSSFFPQNYNYIRNWNIKSYQFPKCISSFSLDNLNSNVYHSSQDLTKVIKNISINNPINNEINDSISSIKFNHNMNQFTNNNSLQKNKIVNNFYNNGKNIMKEDTYFNTQKSIDFSEHDIKIIEDKNSSKIMANSNNNMKKNISNKNINGIKPNNEKTSKNHYYNKFNALKENNMNKNTVILTMKIKVAKNDYRTFNLKKYDDLFVSLEKFLEINKINQELIKPLVTKIFNTLNKIFWLLNNKIGKYDQQYLESLYKLWLKNNKEIPKTRNKNHSDKSTTTSSESSNQSIDKKNIKSKSFQNTDRGSSEEKEERHTSNSF